MDSERLPLSPILCLSVSYKYISLSTVFAPDYFSTALESPVIPLLKISKQEGPALPQLPEEPLLVGLRLELYPHVVLLLLLLLPALRLV